MKRPFGVTSTLLAAFALLLPACSNTATNPTSSNSSGASSGSSNAIPIGVALAQTSNVALLGQEGVAGAKIAEKYFNDKGGIN
ncbi:MAG TPA: hypothetical protein V6D12_02505, partial [Candidatus Obscuribacterales bacterium]